MRSPDDPQDTAVPETGAWLDLLYARSPGYFTVCYLSDGKTAPTTKWFATEDTASAVELIDGIRDTTQVYSSVATYATTKPKGQGRGDVATAISIPGHWADIDYGTAGHNANSVPPNAPDEAHALSIIDGLPAPSALVHTGGGLQPWWFFDDPWVFEDSAEHAHAVATVAAWQARLKRAGAGKGFNVDSVGDLARILRVPGTSNRKLDEPRPVVARFMDGPAHSRAELTPPAESPPTGDAPGSISQALRPIPQDVARRLLRQFVRDDPCGPVIRSRDNTVRLFANNRHVSAAKGTWELVKLGNEGHRGVNGALRAVHDAFTAATAGERGRDAEHEFSELVRGALSQLERPQQPPCRCLVVAGNDRVQSDDPRFQWGDDAFFADGDDLPTIWGPQRSPLWVRGESLMLFGPPSVGKSTLLQSLFLTRIGVRPHALNYPVTDDGRNVLYLAMDRPAQIRRTFRRGLTKGDPKNSRIVVWRGPLDVSLANDKNRDYLRYLADSVNAGVIGVDSIKDTIANPSDEVAAAGYHAARNICLADGVEVGELHHNRKSGGDNRAPRQIDDVYGNRALSAGAGSVLSLWGKSGDANITLTQLKPPGERHPPMSLTLDGETGDFTVDEGTKATLDGALIIAGPDGLSPQEAAMAIDTNDDHLIVDRWRKRLERGGYPTRIINGKSRYYYRGYDAEKP